MEHALLQENRDRKKCCSFCGVTAYDTKRLIAGPGVYICDGCLALAYKIVQEDEGDTTP